MINDSKQTNAPLSSQLIYINHISMFLSAWRCSPQTPEPTVFSLAKRPVPSRCDPSPDLMDTESVIHHKVINMQPSPLTGRWCSGHDALIYSLFSLRLPALSASPAPPPPWLSSPPDMMECRPTSALGRKVEDGLWFVEIRNSSALWCCDRSRRAARAPLVNKLYWELHDEEQVSHRGFPQFDIFSIIH